MSNIFSLFLYLLVFSTSIVLYSLSTKRDLSNKKKRLLFLSSILVVVIFAALRYNVGTDYRTYNNMLTSKKYSSLTTFFADNDTEIGFFLINFIGRLFGSINVTMLICSLITVVFYHLGIRKFELNKVDENDDQSLIFDKNTSLAYMLFILTIFPISFNQVRQTMAMSIVFYAIAFLYKKDYKKFIIFMLVASTIHLTSIFFLSLLLLDVRLYFKNSEKAYKAYLIPGIFLSLVFVIVLNFTFFISLLTKIPFIEHYAYLVKDIDIGGNKDILLTVFILLGVIIFGFKSYKNNKSLQMLLGFIVFAFILSLIGFINPLAKRIAMYMDLVYIVFFIEIVNNRSTLKMKNLFIYGFMSYAVARFVIVYYIMGNSGIFPYSIQLFG